MADQMVVEKVGNWVVQTVSMMAVSMVDKMVDLTALLKVVMSVELMVY